MLIIFHSDNDGISSCAIIKYMYPDAVTYEINYNEEIPWDLIKDNNVFLVDFSFDLEDMKRALKEARKFTYIDHHSQKIKELEPILDSISGLRDTSEKIAACELTWKYIMKDIEVPWVIRLLGAYDVHNYSDPNVLPFQYAMMARETDPKENMNFWCNLFNTEEDPSEFEFLEEDNLIEELIKEGKSIERFVEGRNLDFVKDNAVCVNFEGYKFLAVNSHMDNSNALERVFKPSKWDGMMTFHRKSGGWLVSLYNGKEGKVPCGELAAKYKGGGHFSAAGFYCKELPFKI